MWTYIMHAVQTRLISAQAFMTRSIMQLQGYSSARRQLVTYELIAIPNSLRSILDAVAGFDG